MTKITKKNYKGGSTNIKYEGFCDNHPTQCLEILKSCGGNRRKGLRRYKKARLNSYLSRLRKTRKNIMYGGNGFQMYPSYCDGKENISQCGISSQDSCSAGGKKSKKNIRRKKNLSKKNIKINNKNLMGNKIKKTIRRRKSGGGGNAFNFRMGWISRTRKKKKKVQEQPVPPVVKKPEVVAETSEIVNLEEKRNAFIKLSSSSDGVYLRDDQDVIITRRKEQNLTLESIIQCEFLIYKGNDNTKALNSILGKTVEYKDAVEYKDVVVWYESLQTDVVTGEAPEENEYIEIVKRDDDYYAKLTDKGKQKFRYVHKEVELKDIIHIDEDGTQIKSLVEENEKDKKEIRKFEQRQKKDGNYSDSGFRKID